MVGKIVLIVCIIIVLYLLIGSAIPFVKRPAVSQQTMTKVKNTKFKGHEVTSERVLLLAENIDALEYKLRMIDQAQESIILTTFQIYADEVGKGVISSLIAAAKRGVKVQVLIDGVISLTRHQDNKYLRALAATPNVELKVYNPISFIRPWSANGRMHDKFLIIDEQVYTLGGRNVSGIFLGEKSEYKKYDWDVLVYNDAQTLGTSTKQILTYFQNLWNSKYSKTAKSKSRHLKSRKLQQVNEELKSIYLALKKDYADWFLPIDYSAITAPTKNIQLVANPITPYTKEPIVFYTITELMKNAEQEVRFHTPFIIANKRMLKKLKKINAEVPDVVMMSNSVANNSNPVGALDYQLYKNKILKTGVKILEYDEGHSYHGKCFVIDDDISGLGSFNWDMRSTYIDTETMLIIDSEQFNADLRAAMAVFEAKSLQVINKKKSIPPADHKPQKVAFVQVLVMLAVLIFGIFFRFLF